MTSVFVTLPAFPVMVTAVVWLTAEDTASNPVKLDPLGTVTAVGTLRALLLLNSFTTVGLFASLLKYTEQAFDWTPVSDSVPHEILLNTVVDVFPPALMVPRSRYDTPHADRPRINQLAANANLPE